MKALAPIAIRGDAPNERAVISSRRRKNPHQGCILSRPFFCLLSGPQANQLCPVHAIWPAIAARVKPGERISPGYYGANVNATLKDVLTKLATPYSTRYTSHGFRMGVGGRAQGEGVATVRRRWCRTRYVDTALDVERDMSKLLIDSDAISDEEEDVLSLGNGVPS